MDKWRHSAFLDADDDPLGPLANLIDIVLVFACGLIAALVAFSTDLQDHFEIQPQEITLGKELPQLPENIQQQMQGSSGYEAVGQVYRDPQTGKLVLIGD